MRAYKLAPIHTCSFKNCPPTDNCQLCSGQQYRKCSGGHSSVQQEKKRLLTVCGLPSKVRLSPSEPAPLAPGEDLDAPEVGTEVVRFQIDSAINVGLQLVLIHHQRYEDGTVGGAVDLGTMPRFEFRNPLEDQVLLSHCNNAGFGLGIPEDAPYTVPAEGREELELEQNCCVMANSSKLELGPHGKLRLAVKAVDLATSRNLAYLVGNPFYVLTGRSYSSHRTPIIPDGVPLVNSDPVTVLPDVGDKTAGKRLLHILEYCQEHSYIVPGGIDLPQAVRTAVRRLEDNVLEQDIRLRRWSAPDGRWELLFTADQGRVTANGLEVLLENVVTVSGASMVRIRLNENLGCELGRIVDALRKRALAQLEEDGHVGWSMLGWKGSSLRTFLRVKHPYMPECWEVTKAVCEHLLLSHAELPSLQALQPGPAALLLSNAAPLSDAGTSKYLQSQSESTESSDLEAASPDFAKANQPWEAFSSGHATGLSSGLSAVGAPGGLDSYYTDAYGMSGASYDILEPDSKRRRPSLPDSDFLEGLMTASEPCPCQTCTVSAHGSLPVQMSPIPLAAYASGFSQEEHLHGPDAVSPYIAESTTANCVDAALVLDHSTDFESFLGLKDLTPELSKSGDPFEAQLKI